LRKMCLALSVENEFVVSIDSYLFFGCLTDFSNSASLTIKTMSLM